MKTLPLQSSDTGKLLAALMETMLGAKHFFGQTRPQDATMLQIQVLSLLHASPGLSPTTLRRRLYSSSSAMAQLLQRLGEAGWIRREASANDLRGVKLFLTKDGVAVLGAYGEAQDRERLRKLANTLSGEEKRQLTSLLNKLNKGLQRNSTNEKE